jgi:lysophospholipase L1-like esterase
MAIIEHSSRRLFLRKTALAVVAGSVPLGIVIPEASAAEGKAKGMTVLFQGDSITDGNRGRNADPNHIMGHGYAFSIASRWGADYPSADLVFYNRGISGNKVTQLQARWQKDCLDLHPDVLSILVGINDAALFIEKPTTDSEEVYVQKFEDAYRDILKEVRQQNPQTLIVLGLPFLAPVGKFKQNWDAYYSIVSKLSTRVRNLAVEFDAVLVDFQKVFNEAEKKAPTTYWLWDGIHPTVAGHELMARAWFKDVSRRVRFLRKYA